MTKPEDTIERTGEHLSSRRDRFGDLLGISNEMRRVFAVLERIAPREVTVLLEGESGTGKEVAARSIHGRSRRSEGPFVVVDCGAIPDTLVESELFGHVRGAFTGAGACRVGAFQAASGGTLLLDEIGELPLAMQPKLLRVLDSGQIKPVGADLAVEVNVRVLAATNRHLLDEVEAGRFREDLYYRLGVVLVELPPLRHRPEDIPLLAQRFAVTQGCGEALPRQAVAELCRQPWPGNVRELRNAVERLLVMSELGAQCRGDLTAGDLAVPPTDLAALVELPYHEARLLWVERFEKAYLVSRLEAAGGVVTAAAAAAGLPRQSFHRLLRKHGLRTGHTPIPAPSSTAPTVGEHEGNATPRRSRPSNRERS